MSRLPPEKMKMFTDRMVGAVGDMSDHTKVADWALEMCLAYYRDGYKQGAQDILAKMMHEVLIDEKDPRHATNTSSELHEQHEGGGGGASRDREGHSSAGSVGVPAGEGSETNSGTQPHNASAGCGVSTVGEGASSPRSGGEQG